MNKNLYRFVGVFVAVLGLAYLGHQVFVRASVAPQAQAPVQQAHAPGGNAAAAPAANASAYAVYPDQGTDTALGLSYGSFSGDFVHSVTMTPLPPHAAGRTTLRIHGQKGSNLVIALKDERCAAPVQVVISRIDNKQPVETRELTAASPKFSVEFAEHWLPNLLIETRMGDQAQNNYYCGVAVDWS